MADTPSSPLAQVPNPPGPIPLRGDYVRLLLLSLTHQCIHHYFTTPNTARDRLASEIIAFSTSPLLTHLALRRISQYGLHRQERECERRFVPVKPL
ncbi:hypothetical protein M404DRAFT_439153 [Pisolithus tinctorius Marx 270]|uniref:Uncharacterized protein n=1 Tax=Pisolithus tinctorius Marx 270 TaxID=870435 RepID=A0A0C3JC99_PISTI|nr:hypothetical protein M404DRAFT_439153 [Pisolithus tinctorius Marx 270]